MKELEILKKVIRDAGSAILEFYDEENIIQYKGENDPFTEADLASERVILKGVESFGYGVLSEESTDDLSRLEKEKVWIIDPLDGTKDFIQKTGEFTVMIALVENGELILGLVYQPIEDKLFYAEKGGGAFLEIKCGKAISINVSEEKDFSKMRMLVSRNHLKELEQNIAKELGIVTLVPCGSAGLKACLVASGEAELYLNTSDKTFEWDICAADVIVKEAGGLVLDLKGEVFKFNKKDVRNSDGFIVADDFLCSQVLNIIN